MSHSNPSDQDLPKAVDMLDTVRHEAAELRTFTITFLSLLLYLSLIVAATNHEQILRVSPVVLPLLNVNIPIVGFYWFMPPFLFFMHLYILVQHYLFSQFAFRFEAALQCETLAIQLSIRHRLGNLPFLHWLLGQHGTIVRSIMAFISVISLLIWPVFMFWWMQARFLPYHDERLVLWQQSWLTIDTIFLAYLWAKTLDGSDNPWFWWKKAEALWTGSSSMIAADWHYMKTYWRYCHNDVSLNKHTPNPWRRHIHYLTSWWRSVLRLYNKRRQWFRHFCACLSLILTGLARIAFALLLFSAWFFSWAVSLVPDSTQEKNLIKGLAWIEALTEPNSIISAEKSESNEVDSYVNHWLLENVNFYYEEEERLLFIPTVWLHEKRRIQVNTDEEGLEKYDPIRITEDQCPSSSNDQSRCYRVDSWLPRNLILRERVLTANIDLNPELITGLQAESSDSKTDDLNKISGLNLQDRNFDYADIFRSSLPKANLSRSSLKHASLIMSRMDQAQLQSSRLDGADLISAKLRNASLIEAKLSGADLSQAQLFNADLTGAQLLDAKLIGAQLFGANLLLAQLADADLSQIQLSGAKLGLAQLLGADLSGAQLLGADLSGAQLLGADLSGAQLLGADLREAQLLGADLSGAQLLGADLTEAQLTGADLSGARLAGANLILTQLSGAILNDITYKGLSDERIIKEWLKTFRDNLEITLNYQTTDGKQRLEEKVTELKSRLKQSANFSFIVTEVPCISNNESLTISSSCVAWGKTDKQQKDKIFEAWKNLACQDDTTKRWTARKIVQRSLPIISDITVWPGLTVKLSEALSDATHCQGLAGLTDNLKEQLRKAALNQKTPQKKSLK